MAMAAVVVVCLNQCCNPWSMPLPPPRTNPCKYGNRSPHPRENICITGTSESRCFLCSSFCAHVWLTICYCCLLLLLVFAVFVNKQSNRRIHLGQTLGRQCQSITFGKQKNIDQSRNNGRIEFKWKNVGTIAPACSGGIHAR